MTGWAAAAGAAVLVVAVAWWSWRRNWRLPHEQYRDYIESAAWRRRKRRWYARHHLWARWCRMCWSRQTDLHHRRYRRLGHEWDRDLVPLCRHHHEELHGEQHRRGWTVEHASDVYLRRPRPVLMMAVPLAALVAIAAIGSAAAVHLVV